MFPFLLACDVGNSRTKYGLFRLPTERSSNRGLPECLYAVDVDRHDEVDWTHFRQRLPSDHRSRESVGGVIAGTHPEGVSQAQSTWPRDWVCPPVVFDRPEKLPIATHVKHPERVGIDRLLNAIAANRLRTPNMPAIIVDSGTATTVDVVDAESTFRGGAILPGFQMSARALNHYTALLPLIEMEQLTDGRPASIGDDTQTALRSGLYWGQIGAIRELITQMQIELSMNESPQLIVTGGGASLLHPHFPQARCESHLALKGLACLMENQLQ
ncbi:MAG: type III pantothenate kinase [Planctomycetaceae bacterium]